MPDLWVAEKTEKTRQSLWKDREENVPECDVTVVRVNTVCECECDQRRLSPSDTC